MPGFLANVDEMLEAADAEGAIWRAFVARWWESHHASPIGVGDLYKVAILSEPPIPLGDGNEACFCTSAKWFRPPRGLIRPADQV